MCSFSDRVTDIFLWNKPPNNLQTQVLELWEKKERKTSDTACISLFSPTTYKCLTKADYMNASVEGLHGHTVIFVVISHAHNTAFIFLAMHFINWKLLEHKQVKKGCWFSVIHSLQVVFESVTY